MRLSLIASSGKPRGHEAGASLACGRRLAWFALAVVVPVAPAVALTLALAPAVALALARALALAPASVARLRVEVGERVVRHHLVEHRARARLWDRHRTVGPLQLVVVVRVVHPPGAVRDSVEEADVLPAEVIPAQVARHREGSLSWSAGVR